MSSRHVNCCHDLVTCEGYAVAYTEEQLALQLPVTLPPFAQGTWPGRTCRRQGPGGAGLPGEGGTAEGEAGGAKAGYGTCLQLPQLCWQAAGAALLACASIHATAVLMPAILCH